MTQAVVLNYFEQPLLKEATGVAESGTTVLQWLQDASFTWGHDQRDRQGQHPANSDDNSLHFALQRLALGAIAPATAPAEVLSSGNDDIDDETINNNNPEVSPLQRAAGIAATDLAHLALWWQTLADLRQQWQQPRTLAAWATLVATAIQRCLLTPHSTHSASVSQQIQSVLHEKLAALARDEATSLLSAAAFWRWFEPQLTPATVRLGGGGGVTVAPLATWAGTPAKMVLIAGLGSESFPRVKISDRHGTRCKQAITPRQAGDPGNRDDDRHALLLAVLAAEDRLVLSYTGSSVRDSREQPPSTPLAELQQAIAEIRPEHAAAHHHGLHGGSPSQVSDHRTPDQRSWLASDYSLATH